MYNASKLATIKTHLKTKLISKEKLTMKSIMVTLIIIAGTITIHAQEFRLNAEKSTAKWTGYGELGGFKQEGSIDLKSGQLSVEEGRIQEGIIIYDAKSIDHENKELRKHLRARDFFFVKKYPEISFEITSIYKDKVFGKLSIRDITLEETFTFAKIEKEAILIFEGRARIDRTKYDIKYNSSSYFQDLGNYAIKNEFDLNFRLVFEK